MVTFLEKLFRHPAWKFAIIVSLLGFLGNVLGSVLAFTSLTLESMDWEYEESPDRDTPMVRAGVLGFNIAWAGFSVGIGSLTVFAIKNIL
jgi:hypothetical protein